MEKTFVGGFKTAKFMIVISPESFPLYTVCTCVCVCVHVCVCVFVGSCLATKIFIGNLPAMGRGWVIVNYQQISYMTLSWVHLTMHLMHPN